MREETVTWPNVTVVRGTDRAIRVRRADGGEVWVPSAVVHDDSPVWRPGDVGDLVLAAWWVLRQERDRPIRVWRAR
jgi:hypothetical protein